MVFHDGHIDELFKILSLKSWEIWDLRHFFTRLWTEEVRKYLVSKSISRVMRWDRLDVNLGCDVQRFWKVVPASKYCFAAKLLLQVKLHHRMNSSEWVLQQKAFIVLNESMA